MHPHKYAATVAVLAAVLLAVGSSCTKKVTKLTVEKPVAEEKPAPPPPVDSSEFKQAQLEGEFERMAKEALRNIYFDFNKATIRPESETRLTEIGKFMSNHPSIRILVAGNCDERGSAEYNIGLGQRRAQSAKDFLVTYGVASNRIEVTSYGKERLAVTGCTDEACHAKNRRDEFSVLQGEAKSMSRAGS